MALWIELPQLVQQASDSKVDLSSSLTRWEISLWGRDSDGEAVVGTVRSVSPLASAAAELERLSCDAITCVDSAHDRVHPCRASQEDSVHVNDASPEPRLYAIALPALSLGDSSHRFHLRLRVLANADGTCVAAALVPLTFGGPNGSPLQALPSVVCCPGVYGSKPSLPCRVLAQIPSRLDASLTWPGTSKVHLAASFGITWLDSTADRRPLSRIAVPVPCLRPSSFVPSQIEGATAGLGMRSLFLTVTGLVERATEAILVGLSPQEQLVQVGLSQYAARTLTGPADRSRAQAASQSAPTEHPLLALADDRLRRLKVFVALSRGSGELLTSPFPVGAASLGDKEASTILGAHVLNINGGRPAVRARWTGDWGGTVHLDLPVLNIQANVSDVDDCSTEGETDVHLLLYCLIPEVEGEIAPTCAAFAFLRLYDAEGRFIGTPGCTLHHTNMRFPASGVMRSSCSLSLYPGSPPFLPAGMDGQPLFCPSAPTKRIDADTYASAASTVSALCTGLDLPAHLRLLRQAVLPPPQPLPGQSLSSSSSSAVRQMIVTLGDVGRCQAAGLFPHAIQVELVVVDATHATVADPSIRVAVAAIHDDAGQFTRHSLSKVRVQGEALALRLQHANGRFMCNSAIHDTRLHIRPIMKALGDIYYRFVGQLAGKVAAETNNSAEYQVSRLAASLVSSRQVSAMEDRTVFVDLSSEKGAAVLSASGSFVFVTSGLVDATEAGSCHRQLAHVLLCVMNASLALLSCDDSTRLVAIDGLGIGAFLSATSLAHCATVSALARVKASKPIAISASASCANLPGAVVQTSLDRARLRLADFDRSTGWPLSGTTVVAPSAHDLDTGVSQLSSLLAVAECTAAIDDLCRSLKALSSLLVILKCLIIKGGSSIQSRSLNGSRFAFEKRDTTSAICHALALVIDAAYTVRSIIGATASNAANVANASLRSSASGLLGGVSLVLQSLGEDGIEQAPESVEWALWAHACAALVADMSNNAVAKAVLSGVPHLHPNGVQDGPKSLLIGRTQSPMRGLHSSHHVNPSISTAQSLSAPVSPSIMEKYRRAGANVGSALVAGLNSHDRVLGSFKRPLQSVQASILQPHRVGGYSATTNPGLYPDGIVGEDLVPTIPRAVSPRAMRTALLNLEIPPTTPAVTKKDKSAIEQLLPFVNAVGIMRQEDVLGAPMPAWSVSTETEFLPPERLARLGAIGLANNGCALMAADVLILELSQRLQQHCSRLICKIGIVDTSDSLHMVAVCEIQGAILSASSAMDDPGLSVGTLLSTVWRCAAGVAHAAMKSSSLVSLALRLACTAAHLAGQVQVALQKGTSVQVSAELLLACGSAIRSLPPGHAEAVDNIRELVRRVASSWNCRPAWVSALDLTGHRSLNTKKGSDDLDDGFCAFCVAANEVSVSAPCIFGPQNGIIPQGQPCSGLAALMAGADNGFVTHTLSQLMAAAAQAVSQPVVDATKHSKKLAPITPVLLLPALSFACSAHFSTVTHAATMPKSSLCSALGELIHAALSGRQSAPVSGGKEAWDAVGALVRSIANNIAACTSTRGVVGTAAIKREKSSDSSDTTVLEDLDSVRLLSILVLQLCAARMGTVTLNISGWGSSMVSIMAWTLPLLGCIASAECALCRSSPKAYVIACEAVMATATAARCTDREVSLRQVQFAGESDASTPTPCGVTASILIRVSLRWAAAACGRAAVTRAANITKNTWFPLLAAASVATAMSDIMEFSNGHRADWLAMNIVSLVQHPTLSAPASDESCVIIANFIRGARQEHLIAPEIAASELYAVAWVAEPSCSLHFASALALTIGGRRYVCESEKDCPSGVELSSPTPDSCTSPADVLALAHALVMRAHAAASLWRTAGLTGALQLVDSAGFIIPNACDVATLPGPIEAPQNNVLSPSRYRPGNMTAADVPKKIASEPVCSSKVAQLQILQKTHAAAFGACLGAQQWGMAQTLAAQAVHLYGTILRTAGINPKMALEAPLPPKQPVLPPTLHISTAPQALVQSGRHDMHTTTALAAFARRGATAGTIRKEDLLALQTKLREQRAAGADPFASQAHVAVETATAMIPLPPKLPRPPVATPVQNNTESWASLADQLVAAFSDASIAVDAVSAIGRQSNPTDTELASWAAADRRANECMMSCGGSFSGQLVQLSPLLLAGIPALPHAMHAAVCLWGRGFTSYPSPTSILPHPCWTIVRLPLDMSIEGLMQRMRVLYPQAHVFGPDAPVSVAVQPSASARLAFCGSGSRASDCRLMGLRSDTALQGMFAAPSAVPTASIFTGDHIYVFPAMPVEQGQVGGRCRYRALFARCTTLNLPPAENLGPLPSLAPVRNHILRALGPVLHADGFKLNRDVPDRLLDDAEASGVCAMDFLIGNNVDRSPAGVVGLGVRTGWQVRDRKDMDARSDLLPSPAETSAPAQYLCWAIRSVAVPASDMELRPMPLLEALHQWSSWAHACAFNRLAWLVQLKLEVANDVADGATYTSLKPTAALDAGIMLTGVDGRSLGLEPEQLAINKRAAIVELRTVEIKHAPAAIADSRRQSSQSARVPVDSAAPFAGPVDDTFTEEEDEEGGQKGEGESQSTYGGVRQGSQASAKLAVDTSGFVFGVGGGVVDDEFPDEDENASAAGSERPVPRMAALLDSVPNTPRHGLGSTASVLGPTASALSSVAGAGIRTNARYNLPSVDTSNTALPHSRAGSVRTLGTVAMDPQGLDSRRPSDYAGFGVPALNASLALISTSPAPALQVAQSLIPFGGLREQGGKPLHLMSARSRDGSLSEVFGSAENEMSPADATGSAFADGGGLMPVLAQVVPGSNFVRHVPSTAALAARHLIDGAATMLASNMGRDPLAPAHAAYSVRVPQSVTGPPGGATSLLPSSDFQPALSALGISSRVSAGAQDAAPPSNASLVAVPSSTGTSPSFGLAVVPIAYAARVLECGLVGMQAAGTGLAFPAGPGPLRTLMSDYAELKVLEREKATTELRREFCRREDAARSSGINTDSWAVPDWGSAVARTLHPRIPQLEKHWTGMALALSEAARLHGLLLVHASGSAQDVGGRTRTPPNPELEAGIAAMFGGPAALQTR